MAYYTDEQWNAMSEDARQSVIEIAFAKFDEEHPTSGSAALGLIRARIHATSAQPDEQIGILGFLFELFGVKR